MQALARISPAQLRVGALVLLFAAALSVRLVGAATFVQTPYFRFTLVGLDGPDQNAYYEWARAIQKGTLVGEKLSSGQAFPFSPVYPALVALGFGIDTRSVVWTLYLQCLISALLVIVFYRFGRSLSGEVGGWSAALLWACYGPSVFYDACLIRDSLVTSLCFLLAYVVYRNRSSGAGWRAWAGAGLLAGAAFVLREHPVVLFLPLAVWCAPRQEVSGGRNIRRLVVLILPAVLAVAPFTLYNAKVSGRLLPVSAQGAEAFWLGNTPGDPAAGHWPTPRARALQTESGDGLWSTARVFVRQAAQDPAGYARLYWRKIRLFLKDYEIPGNYSYEVYRRVVPVSALAPGRFAWVLGLAVVGIALSWRQSGRWYEVRYFATILAVAALLIHIQSRYRFALVPYLILWAGCGAAGLVELWRQRRWRSGAAATVLMLAVCAYAMVPPTTSLFLDRLTPAGQERKPLPALLESDYLTLIVSYYFSADKRYIPDLNSTAREAYTVYGDGIRQKFESSMRVLYQRKKEELLGRVYVSEIPVVMDNY